MKFNLGDKVKFLTGPSKGKTGIITAIYDRKFTPIEYSRADYRVSFQEPGVRPNRYNNAYADESSISPIHTIRAYCYKGKPKTALSGQIVWRSEDTSYKNLVRVPDFDMEKEVEWGD